MTHARRILTFMIAAAVAISPVGSAMAASLALEVDPVRAMHVQHQTHAAHREHATGQVAVSENHGTHQRCDGKNSDNCCCGDHKANCAEPCLHKCFGQLGLIPSSRFVAAYVLDQFDMRAMERPPDWVHDPQTPPPRT